MHSRMFVVVCIASTFMSMPCISMYLFSVWLCLESQSVMKSSGFGLYIIPTQNWHTLRRMCCILCDKVATSFLNITTRGLWLVYYIYLPSKAIMVKSFKTMQYTQCLSFDVTVSSFCTDQAFACKCDWPQNGVVWCCIPLACHSISSL